MRICIALASFAILLLAGCSFGTLPNPNDPSTKLAYDGESLQKSVRQVDEMLMNRVLKGEINMRQKQAYFQEFVSAELEDISVEEIPTSQAWRFADVYRQIDDWETTNQLYLVAVDNATNEDRRVNDTLRLAESEAMLGNVSLGIDLARSTFDVEANGKAPILLATLYEFVPAALAKDEDMAVAALLEQATEQHLRTIVDPETASGIAFIKSRFHHIREAWSMIIRIYRVNNEMEMMRDAIERSDMMLRRFADI